MTTTTAATNSASTSIPNDSPRLHDNDAVSESITEHMQQQQQQHHQEHNHFELKDPNIEVTEQSSITEQARQGPAQQLSPDNNASISTLSTVASTTVSTTTTTTATAASITTATPADEQNQLEQSPSSQQQQSTTNSGTNNNTEQKRPMNAFFLYCQRQRSSVREQNPNLENRGITKILGDSWSKLDEDEKLNYKILAKKQKEAFMKANPDYKWCKTPSVSNINNNFNANNDGFNSNGQQHQQNQHLQRQQQNHHPSITTNVEMLSIQSIHHPMDIVHHSTNSIDLMLTNKQQLEAPKPPKKRFLERNDSIYVTKNNFTSNHQDSTSHGTDVVPYISLDQDTLDRVIDHAFSEESSSSPSGLNTCKCSNRTSTNFTSSSDTNPTSFSSSSTSAYSASTDEPVDFSMNRTINTTRQQIINNLVEKMLSKPSDDGGGFSKMMNGTDSVKVQSRPTVRKDNRDDT